MISDKQALDLYQEAAEGSLTNMDEEEKHLVVDSVRRVRSATSVEEAVSAILWMGGNEQETARLVSEMRK